MNDETVRSKIAKLMAMGMDGRGNEHEAESALRMAEKLMRKHNIDRAEILERDPTVKIQYNWTTELVPVSHPRPVKQAPLWFGWMVATVGLFTDTRVQLRYHTEKQMCAQFMGDETDVEYAIWLCAHLRDAIRNEAAAYAAPGLNSDQKWRNREEFRHSMARRLNRRMNDLIDERKTVYSQSTALVVVNDKIKQRDTQFGVQQYAKSKARPMKGDKASQMAGIAAAERVNLHKQVK